MKRGIGYNISVALAGMISILITHGIDYLAIHNVKIIVILCKVLVPFVVGYTTAKIYVRLQK